MSFAPLVISGREIHTVLAPMAGFTDVAFRELCRECGAGLSVTEMVSVRGLVHGSEATAELMRLSQTEKPSCIQLFGSEPNDFARAAELVDCDVIDINMGCPMPKIVKNGDGAALLKAPKRAGEIVRAVKNATDRPVTVKTRLGYAEGDGTSAAELIESVAQAGAAAVALHGRYAAQRYAGESDIAAVKRIAAQSDIPIIANGDIESAASPDFGTVMIGRAALANPYVFSGGAAQPFEIANKYLRLLTKYFDERYTVFQCRKMFVHFFKGVRGGRALREAINTASDVKDVSAALDNARRIAYN